MWMGISITTLYRHLIPLGIDKDYHQEQQLLSDHVLLIGSWSSLTTSGYGACVMDPKPSSLLLSSWKNCEKTTVRF